MACPAAAVAGAVATFTLLAWRGPAASRVVSLFLALSWMWMAIAYHLAFFARINPAAMLFAGLFAAACEALGTVPARLGPPPARG